MIDVADYTVYSSTDGSEQKVNTERNSRARRRSGSPARPRPASKGAARSPRGTPRGRSQGEGGRVAARGAAGFPGGEAADARGRAGRRRPERRGTVDPIAVRALGARGRARPDGARTVQCTDARPCHRVARRSPWLGPCAVKSCALMAQRASATMSAEASRMALKWAVQWRRNPWPKPVEAFSNGAANLN